MNDEEAIKVYDFTKDVEQILYNVVSDLKSKKQLENEWDLTPKELEWCNLKIQGDNLQLRVEILRGGYRTSHVDTRDMNKYAAETRKLLSKFENAVRSEFKKRAGKALRWSQSKFVVNYEPVALNNMYKFYAFKSGKITVDVGRQQHDSEKTEFFTAKKKGNKVVDLDKIGDDKRYQ